MFLLRMLTLTLMIIRTTIIGTEKLLLPSETLSDTLCAVSVEL
jgi:hypothetical protein